MLTAFPLQQWLHEGAPLLSYTYTVFFGGGLFNYFKLLRKYSRLHIMYKLKNVWKQTNTCG